MALVLINRKNCRIRQFKTSLTRCPGRPRTLETLVVARCEFPQVSGRFAGEGSVSPVLQGGTTRPREAKRLPKVIQRDSD